MRAGVFNGRAHESIDQFVWHNLSRHCLRHLEDGRKIEVFDGNLESVSSDVVFNPLITRSIHVDLRYALWVMDKVDGADHLLTELGLTPSL